MLHREHLAVIGLMFRFRDYLSARPADRPPSDEAAGDLTLLGDLRTALRNEIDRHFEFEETQLFPRLAESGEPGIGVLLRDEHDIMRPWANEVVDLASGVVDRGWTEAAWPRFHEVGSELAGTLISHIQKETMGLLPLLEEILDDETDRTLSVTYADG